MDFERRIQEAQQHVDQTRGAYERAQRETGQAMDNYNQSITTAPNFQTYYEKYKQQYQDTAEIRAAKSTWQNTKEAVDALRTRIDKLSESINQQFGGTFLTAAQRERAKQQQNQELSSQFTQYNAAYQTQFADYNKKVEDAFNTSMDVANKDYDRYWKVVRKKFDIWRAAIKNEEQWNKRLCKGSASSWHGKISLQHSSELQCQVLCVLQTIGRSSELETVEQLDKDSQMIRRCSGRINYLLENLLRECLEAYMLIKRTMNIIIAVVNFR